MNGPFDDPAFIAAEAWYLEQPVWKDWDTDRACDLWELQRELGEHEERFWDDEEEDE